MPIRVVRFLTIQSRHNPKGAEKLNTTTLQSSIWFRSKVVLQFQQCFRLLYLQQVRLEVDPAFRDQLNKQLQEEGIEALVALLKTVDPVYHQKVDLGNPHRLIRALEVCLSSGQPYSSFLGNKKDPTFFKTQKIVIQWDRPILYDRINLRVDQMVSAGLEAEARSLYPSKDVNALQTVGYREWFSHFDTILDRKTTLEEIKKNTRRYAKRQMTWFKRYQDALWIPGGCSVEDVLKRLH